jgi:CO/xanthine dehydrogenase Mo-binding subunit
MPRQTQRRPPPSTERSRAIVGANVPKVDIEEKVTGAATYGSDRDDDELLHAGMLTSTRPHARIVDVDATAALAVDGVVAVVPRTEFPGAFDDRVRHYGDVIAAVAAETREAADRAVGALSFELDSLESVHDPHEALAEDAPVVHENNVDMGQHGQHDVSIDNPAYARNVDDYHAVEYGSPERGFAAADYVLEEEYTTPRVEHCNLDTHCVVAEWEGETLTLTEALGSHGRGSHAVAAMLGIDPDQVRIREPETAGSSFGGRSLAKRSVEPVAAILARETGRPVRLRLDRELEFVATSTRHPTWVRLRTGVTDAGDITALDLDLVADTGAYPNGVGHVVLSNSRDRPLDVYDLPNYRYEGVAVFTNNVPAGEYRAIGSTQLAFVLESHIDEVAREVGIDPLAFRRRNALGEGDARPYTDAPVSTSGLADCLDQGAERFETLRRGPTSDPDLRRGWGVGVGAHGTTSGALAEDSSEVLLRLAPDGTVTARTGAVDIGQGAYTVVAQIVAQETGVPLEAVDVARYETTDEFHDHLGSVAARSTYVIGAAVRDAALALGSALRERAADRFGVDAASVGIDDGVATAPSGETVPVGALVTPADGGGLLVTGAASTTETPTSYGAHFAEVEVDTRTGAVDVVTYVAAQDVGYAIHPTMVEGQLEGAVQHGIEFALYSELRLERGSPTNANLAEYPVSSPFEMPDEMDCVVVESNEESGPYGAKGLGTPAMPPVAPAVANALRDATGHRFHDPPVGDEPVRSAVQSGPDAESGRTDGGAGR